jgi:hypothetical protein
MFETQIHLPERLVIVIDALDECEDNVIVDIVSVLATTLDKYDPSIRMRWRFLVTSRPEKYLLEFFHSNLHISCFDLSTVNSDEDILIFVEHELHELGKNTAYELKKEDARLLAKISGGVFIAARIAVDFVGFGKSPDSQLQKLRNDDHTSGLDVIYRFVLDTIAQESSVWNVLQPIATVILSFRPLSKLALTNLLHIKIEQLDPLLHALRAIIHVRKGDEIYPIHASLRDFLTNPVRCTDRRVFVDPAHHHGMISRACFARMTSLLQKPLRDLPRNGKKFLPDDLTYACRYWARHFAESNLDRSLMDLLGAFASSRLLYWIEYLSLIGDLDLGTSGLGIVINILVSPRLNGCEHKAELSNL